MTLSAEARTELERLLAAAELSSSPEMLALADLCRRALAGENVDVPKVKVIETFRLEKFDGEYEPGKVPVEIIEGGDDRPTTIARKGVDY